VGMGDQNPQERWIGFPQSTHLGEQVRAVLLRIERKAKVQQKPLPSGFQFDTTSADLVGAAMDADAQEIDPQ